MRQTFENRKPNPKACCDNRDISVLFFTFDKKYVCLKNIFFFTNLAHTHTHAHRNAHKHSVAYTLFGIHLYRSIAALSEIKKEVQDEKNTIKASEQEKKSPRKK